jgi:hypothetical protein
MGLRLQDFHQDGSKMGLHFNCPKFLFWACPDLLDGAHLQTCTQRGRACCRYVRPTFVGSDEEPQLLILEGRHPVLAATREAAQVVPNDTCLRGCLGPRVSIVTGPNMGGKSCYIRQAALIAIMAQASPLPKKCPRDAASLK